MNENINSYLTEEEIKTKMNKMEVSRRICMCGHTVYVAQVGRCLCTYCGRYVYRSERDKFKYLLLQEKGDIDGKRLCNKEIDRIVNQARV